MIKANTGHRVKAPPKPSALIVSVVALINVASSAHNTAVALANSAALRAGEPRCAKTTSTTTTTMHTNVGAVHADVGGR